MLLTLPPQVITLVHFLNEKCVRSAGFSLADRRAAQPLLGLGNKYLWKCRVALGGAQAGSEPAFSPLSPYEVVTVSQHAALLASKALTSPR